MDDDLTGSHGTIASLRTPRSSATTELGPQKRVIFMMLQPMFDATICCVCLHWLHWLLFVFATFTAASAAAFQQLFFRPRSVGPEVQAASLGAHLCGDALHGLPVEASARWPSELPGGGPRVCSGWLALWLGSPNKVASCELKPQHPQTVTIPVMLQHSANATSCRFWRSKQNQCQKHP